MTCRSQLPRFVLLLALVGCGTKKADEAPPLVLPKQDFAFLEETLDPAITSQAKLIGPAATDGTKLDPIAPIASGFV